MSLGFLSEGQIVQFTNSGNTWKGDAVCISSNYTVIQSTVPRQASGIGVALKNAGPGSGIAVVTRGVVRVVKFTGVIPFGAFVKPDASGSVRVVSKSGGAVNTMSSGIRASIGIALTSGTNKAGDILLTR